MTEDIQQPQAEAEPVAADAPVAAPDFDVPQSTHDRLLAFEDKHLGEDHPRPYGWIERGIGSKFAGLHPRHKTHHAALEALIAAEAEHRQASAAEATAHAKLDAAIKRAAATEEASNG